MRTDRHFIEVFEEIVARHGDLTAIEFAGAPHSTYKQLSAKAKKLALKLLKRGVRPETYVGIGVSKSPDYVVSMLAIWYAGAAFVPFDPKLPETRLAQIKDDCNLDLIITSDLLHECHQPECHQPECHQGNWQVGDDFDCRKTALDALAYAIFTSGSSGRPKGVEVTHRGIVNLLLNQIEIFQYLPGSRSLFLLSTNFDASISDIGCALLSGATLCMDTAEALQAGPGFSELLRERQISHMDCPPSLLSILNPENMPDSLKTIVIGGEVCPPAVVRDWAEKFRLVNVYGPTEATVCTSAIVCDAASWERPLIGKTLPGISYRVIDDELYIAGVSLARGYLNRPELNDLKFVNINGMRMYRTGDRVHERTDGQFEFLGRIDRQIKLRGLLVEPEEIEACLANHPAIAGAAVLKRTYGNENQREGLVAFLELVDGNCAPSIRSMKSFLSARLPSWMIPMRFQFASSLPRTASGKVDLDKLRECPLQSASANEGNSCSEHPLLDVIKTVLAVDQVSFSDNFFDLGGDSFAVVELSLAAEAKGFKLPPALVIANPQIGSLVEAVTQLAQSDSTDTTQLGVMKAEALRDDVKLTADWRQILNDCRLRKGLPSRIPQTIFLTGATGFLGSRLLYELIFNTDAAIFCLVRCEDKPDGLLRIVQALSLHKLSLSSDQLARIRVIPGDLGQPAFGLPPEDWSALVQHIDTIYHCAALVNIVLPYKDLKAVNVDGTREVARMMAQGRVKCLHYASTLSVFVATDQNVGTVYEQDDLSATKLVYGGYGQSKWAAEVFLRSLGKDVGHINFYRFGLIVSDMTGGGAPKADFFSLFTRGIALLGCVPDLELGSEIALDITPVDFASSAMAAISLIDQREGQSATYHIANQKSLSLRELIASMRDGGVQLESVTANEFRLRVSSLLDENALTASESAACLALCRTFDRQAFERLRSVDLFQSTGVSFDMTNTKNRFRPMCPSAQDWAIGQSFRRAH